MKCKNGMRLLLPFAAAFGGIVLLSGNVSASELSTMAMEPSTATAVTTLSTMEETPEGTGWKAMDSGRKYFRTDGEYLTGAISVDGVTYLLDADGFQQTGWQVVDGVRHYYDPETGEAAIGVQEIDGTAFLFDFTGAQKTGWRTVNGVRQYYDPETGEILSGWIDYCGRRYYADEETGKYAGELTMAGKRYLMNEEYGYQQLGFCTFSDNTISYYQEDGSAVSGWLEEKNRTYYFDSAYRMQTGWQTIDGKTYYFNESGVRLSGWHNISQNQYYLNSDGVMQTGWQVVGGKTYYFSESGVMQTGWQETSGYRYYFGTDGAMQTGFVKDGAYTYYLNDQGRMVKSWQTIGGKNYYFDGNGRMQTGFLKLGTGTYYMNGDGVMQTGWQTIQGKQYFFQTNGVMLTNTTKDGYRIGADGVAVKDPYPKATAILNQVGWNLKSAFQWSASLKYYGHNANMPQTAAPGTKWYADYGFTNLKGNCYVMAATFCEMARNLGYNACQISGQVPLRSGGLGPHSWVEIAINGTTYVFDPDFTNETGRNGYQITYGQSGTWRYVKGSVMSD